MDLSTIAPVLQPGKTLTNRELARVVRQAICAEHDAVHLYELIVDSSINPMVKSVLQDIADEEKVHVGELEEVLSTLDPENDDFVEEGREEVGGMFDNDRITAIVDSIMKEAMPMKVLPPTRPEMKKILSALRSYFGIQVAKKPLYRKYLTYSDDRSNKYHYFVVFEKSDGMFAVANAYGRIGYNPRVADLGDFENKADAIRAADKKMNAKKSKGYKETPVPAKVMAG